MGRNQLMKILAFILALAFILQGVMFVRSNDYLQEKRTKQTVGRHFESITVNHTFLSVLENVFADWKLNIRTNFSRRPDFVLGVPTVIRKNENYLHKTLRSLLDNMGNEINIVIVVYVGEENETAFLQTKQKIRHDFLTEMESEIVQIIGPPKDFYPKFREDMHRNFGDSLDRVKWRSKQVIDQVFLMMYSYYLKPKFYVMLEDDIIASKNYMTKIKKDTIEKRDTRYVMLMYSQLGNIGRLFKREILPSIATFFCLFWSDKPIDWLVIDYIRSRECYHGKSDKDCDNRVNEMAIRHSPSLFQHIGKVSSLKGKIQNLRDNQFIAGK